MSDNAVKSFHEANQEFLTQAFEDIRRMLDACVEGQSPGESVFAPWPTVNDDFVPPMVFLAQSFDLTPFERWLVLLCAGMELDASIPAACAAAHGDRSREFPTFGLALAALPESHWSALAPAATLRHWRIIEVDPGATLLNSRLRIDERILHHLLGVDYIDERLGGLMAAPGASVRLVPSHRDAAQELARRWGPVGDDAGFETIQIVGPDAAVKLMVARVAAAACGLDLMRMSARAIPEEPEKSEAVARLWHRESRLGRYALLIEADDLTPDHHDSIRRVLQWVSDQPSPMLISSRDPLSSSFHHIPSLEVGSPTSEEQRALWEHELRPHGADLNGQISELVSQFDLSADGIRSACLTWRRTTDSAPDDDTSSAGQSNRMLRILWNACRSYSRPSMDDLANRIVSRVTWEDLILPEEQIELLREAATHVRHRYRVYREWGFADKSDRGLGITALFHGPSGTGKTLAAEVIAHELNLDLYRIDLSRVVSRYIGETEANLRRVFDAAEGGGAVLLFDEADALYGKRSEVRDSHDRHANIEVSYLLQRMEAYRGLAILTTNMKEALDEAFLRRIRFLVAFPFPNGSQREAIWRRVFPEGTPVDGLDFTKVAELSVTGGSIRNMAMHAAFMAADSGGPVRMRHLLRAARVEYAKLERPLHGINKAEWV